MNSSNMKMMTSLSIKLAGLALTATALIGVPLDALAQTPAATKPKPAVQAGTQGAGNSKVSDADIVARVGEVNLSADDVRAYVAALGPREQEALAQDPALLSQAVRMILAGRLVTQEVATKKWDQQPGVAAQLDRIRENALSELYLQSVSTPPANYPSDEELQKVYDANRTALLVPRQFQLAQIFIAAPKDADKAAADTAKKTVDDIARRLKASGADFAAIANENAALGDAKNGGDLGWVPENQIRPEIRTQVIGLAKNAVSEPIKLDDGWHIIKLVDTKASYTRTLPEVRDQLVQQMRIERAKALRQAYLGELIKRNPPVLNEIALSKVLGDQTRATR